MVQYRRSQATGASFFFTVNLQDRTRQYLTDYANILREAISTSKQQAPFIIDAIVILPDHLHAVFSLPEGDSGYPKRWRAIKSRFTKALVKEGVPLCKNHKGEYNLWQRRYWEHQIRDEPDMQRHVDYIHFNPVKHGFVARVADWPHSSFHRYVEQGLLPKDWAGGHQMFGDTGFGE